MQKHYKILSRYIFFYSKKQIQFMSDFINKCGGAHGNLTAENIIELGKLLNDKYGGDRSPLQIVYKLYKCGLILSKTLQLYVKYFVFHLYVFCVVLQSNWI